MLNEYGKAVRKARIDTGSTLLKMSKALNVSVSYLSQMETGKVKLSLPFVSKVEKYFFSLGHPIKLLQKAEISNNSASLEGLNPEMKELLTGFARANLNEEDIRRIKKILEGASRHGESQ